MAEDDNEEALHQPHDKLFVQGFSDPANAAGLLKTMFSEELATQIDWEGLELQNGSFIDSQFRKSQTDLLFATTLAGGSCRLHVIFEHQSSPDRLMALRLLRYQVRIWEAFDKEHAGEPLPVILSVVLAQNGSRWEVPTRLKNLLKVPPELEEALLPYIPDFAFQLLQLAEVPYRALPGTPAGILVLRVMKAERLNQLLDDAVWDEALLEQTPEQLFEFILRYVLAADIDKEGFESRLSELQNPQLRTNAMSLAQVYRQEGRREGRV
ncbi:MAG: Rpn family recombination-promoting nuclease/putative transposase, partial [Verrucomicrobiales bacterium]|nr:Rpn family recombination-promoting nuclease/putative transposase [Verrucomicrobiales bacterium]